MATDNFFLSGPAEADVQSLQREQDIRELQAIGTAGPSAFLGLTTGRLFGRAINQAMGATEDPQIQQARALESAKNQILQTGLIPGDPGFDKAAVGILNRHGLYKQAVMARQLHLEVSKSGVDLRGATANARTAEATATKAEATATPESIDRMTRQDIAQTQTAEAQAARAGVMSREDVLAAEVANIKASADTAQSQAALARFNAKNAPVLLAADRAETIKKAQRDAASDAISFQNAYRNDATFRLTAIGADGMRQALTAMNQLSTGTENEGVSDLQLVMGLYKIMDPNSAVKADEADLSAARASSEGFVSKWANRLAGRGNLTNAERRQIYKQARETYKRRLTDAQKLVRPFEALARRNLDATERDVAMAPLRALEMATPVVGEFKMPKRSTVVQSPGTKQLIQQPRLSPQEMEALRQNPGLLDKLPGFMTNSPLLRLPRTPPRRQQ